MAHDTFAVGDLVAVVGDNSAHEGHRAGYNGVWSLSHKKEPANLFVPAVAGLNFEHIFDGDGAKLPEGEEGRKVFFEPRHAPMTFKKIADDEAELHQPPTPTFHLESRTRFKLFAPHFIDLTFRCRAGQHVFKHGYIGLFWASYINAPHDKSMYLRGKQDWLQLCTAAHNNQSTVTREGDGFEVKCTPGHRDTLYHNLSPLKYELPLFYGLFREMVFAVMFESSEGIRFTHSPSGGGRNAEQRTTNPAWDFQLVIPKYEVMQEYGFRARVMYRPRCSREEILAEYERWKGA